MTFDPVTHEKHAFAMRLHPGCADEYRRRHDVLWPDLAALLREAGVADYSIHLEPGTGLLFAVLWRRRDHSMAALPDHPVMRRWWAHMADIMETEPSGAPVVLPLRDMFHLPVSAVAPRRVAVLDVGKTNVKLVVVDAAEGREIWTRTAPNRVRTDGPYPHADVGAIEAFLVDALADAAAEAGVEAVSITTHGATGALIGSDGLVLPVLDYEHDGPDAVADDYARVRPGFGETFSPRLRGGLNLGAQLFWQAHAFPQSFARASALVTYPQYWAWRLTGVASTEPTSLGCHTDLWAPGRGGFSTLVARMGWDGLMAPVRSAFDRLGPLSPEIARRAGLGGAVPVACGIHDSNASLLPHIQGSTAPQAIVSTGTWIVAFAVGGSLDRLDPDRDTLANVDAHGRPVPSARFMGGREFDILTDGWPEEPDAALVTSVIERRIMACPSFALGSGPFPGRAGRWSHDPDGLTAPERTAVASLYAALMTATCLDGLGAAGSITIEGPFARNALYCDALAAAAGRTVAASTGATGTSLGAARLLGGGGAAPCRPSVRTARDLGPAFDAYVARWRRDCASS